MAGTPPKLYIVPPPNPPSNAFSSMVAQEYLEFFQFEGQTLDRALRYGGVGLGFGGRGGGCRPPYVPPLRLIKGG